MLAPTWGAISSYFSRTTKSISYLSSMLASERPATLPPTIMTLKGDFSDIFVLVHFERGMMVNVLGEKEVRSVGISMATSPISVCKIICQDLESGPLSLKCLGAKVPTLRPQEKQPHKTRNGNRCELYDVHKSLISSRTFQIIPPATTHKHIPLFTLVHRPSLFNNRISRVRNSTIHPLQENPHS